MNPDVLLMALLGAAMLLLALFVWYRDERMGKKLTAIERAIETLHKQHHLLERNMDHFVRREEMDLESRVRQEASGELAGLAETMVESVRELREEMDHVNRETGERLKRLEDRTKEYMSVPNMALDEKRVVALHQAGHSAEEIARELRANVSEVAFVLKLKSLT